MSKRRIYVNVDELVYRGLKRLGVYSGECAGMIAERTLNALVADHILRDGHFARWMEAEHRDIIYGTKQDPLPPASLRRSRINSASDDYVFPRSPQD